MCTKPLAFYMARAKIDILLAVISIYLCLSTKKFSCICTISFVNAASNQMISCVRYHKVNIEIQIDEKIL